MANKGTVKVGIIGSRFQGDIHAASFQMIPDVAEVVAIASPTPGNAQRLADRYGIRRVFTDCGKMLAEKDIEMVTIAAPNSSMFLDNCLYCPDYGPRASHKTATCAAHTTRSQEFAWIDRGTKSRGN